MPKKRSKRSNPNTHPAYSIAETGNQAVRSTDQQPKSRQVLFHKKKQRHMAGMIFLVGATLLVSLFWNDFRLLVFYPMVGYLIFKMIDTSMDHLKLPTQE